MNNTTFQLLMLVCGIAFVLMFTAGFVYDMPVLMFSAIGMIVTLAAAFMVAEAVKK